MYMMFSWIYLILIQLIGNNGNCIDCTFNNSEICRSLLHEYHNYTGCVYNGTKLYYRNSGLTEIPTEICNIYGIDSWYLDGNYIDALNTQTRIPCVKYIRVMTLSSNNMSSISKDYFHAFTYMDYLDLSSNRLSSLEPCTFLSPNLRHLRYINLSFNRLKELDMWIFKLPALTSSSNYFAHVNVSHNQISNLKNTINFSVKEVGDWMGLSLDLRYNLLTSMLDAIRVMRVTNVVDFKRLMSMNFFAKNNPFHCGCDMHDFLAMVGPYVKIIIGAGNFSLDLIQIECFTPKHLRGKYGIYLDMDQFQCDVTPCDTEERCDCVKTPQNSTLRVMCTSKNINTFPKLKSTGWFSNYELNLANNHISGIEKRLYIGNISKLDLTGNKLKIFQKENLKMFSNLKILSLKDNLLETIPEGINEGILPLTDVKLGGNPFHCNCTTNQWFKSWISSKKHPISDLKKIVCEKPDWKKGTLITDFDCHGINVVVLSTSLTVAFIFIITVIVGIYLSRRYIHIYMFTRFGWRLHYDYSDETKDYDVFISYSNRDAEEVEQIADQLEEWDPPYRVCLHYRDFTPGESIAENIISSIQSSKCTVIMVSDNFLKSYWCRYEFKAAHYEAIKEHNSKVLIVLLEQVSESNMDRDLKLYTKTHTYLEKCDPKFFTRFRMGLPIPSGKRNMIGV